MATHCWHVIVKAFDAFFFLHQHFNQSVGDSCSNDVLFYLLHRTGCGHRLQKSTTPASKHPPQAVQFSWNHATHVIPLFCSVLFCGSARFSRLGSSSFCECDCFCVLWGWCHSLPSLAAFSFPTSSTSGRYRMIATWLILPVVIRLSQRLSHACLSINNLYCETANGSLYQL